MFIPLHIDLVICAAIDWSRAQVSYIRIIDYDMWIFIVSLYQEQGGLVLSFIIMGYVCNVLMF